MRHLKNYKNILYLILFAFIQYPLKIQGIKWMTYVFIYIIPILYLLMNREWLLGFFNRFRIKLGNRIIYFIVYLILISALWPLVFKTYDFTYITIYWRSVFLLCLKNIFLVAVYEKLFISSSSKIGYMKYFIYSTIMYIVFTLIILLIPNFRELLMQLLYLTPQDVVNLSNPSYITRFGWSGWSGFGLTMYCTIALTFSWILILRNKNNFFKQIKYLICIILLLIGNAFYGRTGILASCICTLFGVIYLVYNHQYKLFVLIVLSCITLFCVLFVLKDYNESIYYWYNWIFSIIRNLFESGSLYDDMGTVETLFERMYFIPSLKTLLIGDAYYTVNGQYYLLTDVGFMRPVLYFGVINYLISLFVYFKCIFAFSMNACFAKIKDKYFILLLFIVLTIVFEFKGESICNILPVFLPILLIEDKQLNNNDFEL